MADLLKKHVSLLLAEIEQILTEKWPLEVNIGHGYLQIIVNSFRAVFEPAKNDDDDQNDPKRDKKNDLSSIDRNFYVNQLSSLNECNLAFSRLRNNLTSLDTLAARLGTIQRSLSSLINMKVNLFECDDDDCVHVDWEEFRTCLSQIVESFEAELRLKREIVEKLLVKSRVDQAYQVTLVSMWIHQPYVSEPLVDKFIATIKFYSK